MKNLVIHIWPDELGGNATVMPGEFATRADAEAAAKRFESDPFNKGRHRYVAATWQPEFEI